MSISAEGILKLFSKRKALVSIAVAATLVATSALAMTALSGPAGEAVLTILGVTATPEEAYVDEAVVWTVVVEIQDQGQQGKGILFTWDWDDGTYTVYHMKSLVSESTAIDIQTHAWSVAGVYEVVVSVYDGYEPEKSKFHNVSAMTTFTVKDAEPNTPPVADFHFWPGEGTVDTTFMFNASSSYDSEDPTESLLVRWDWESDGVWDTNYSTEQAAEHQFESAGEYLITLEVKDTGGLTDFAWGNLKVAASTILTPHDPIEIYGDTDFVPENGVICGAGTYDDPYVIGGWYIEPASGNGITVLSTTKYFTIRDTRIVGVIDNYTYGVYLENVNHAVLQGVNVSGFWMGIHAKLTADLTVTACQSTWNSWGMFALRCGSIYVTENEMSHNMVGSGNHEGIMVQETDYAYIARNNLVDNWDGVFMYIVSSGHVFNNTISESAVGVQALYSSFSAFGNSISSRLIGMVMVGCVDTNIEMNQMTRDPSSTYSHFGVKFGSCTRLYVSGNVIDSYRHGIGTEYDPYVAWPDSEDVIVSSNIVSNCGDSGLRAHYVSNLTVTENAFQSNGVGIYVHPSATGVRVNHNDLLYNAVQATEDPLCVGNEWDDGYPSGGNYWSDYAGVDWYSGVDQTVPGADGIGDTPYVLPSGSIDRYPLMEPATQQEGSAPAALFTVDPPAGPAGMAFRFDASASSDAEDPAESLQVRWDWESDGVWDTDYSADKEAERVYEGTGTYTVSLEVRDSEGMTGLASQDVSVLAPPVMSARAPITIESDGEFTAENGVVAGSGSPDDPYIISGWRINSADSSCISITNTGACFVVYGVELTSESHDFHAMSLQNVSDGHLVASALGGGLGGLEIEACSSVSVVGCDFVDGVYGVVVSSSTDFGLRDCAFDGALQQAFAADSSDGFSVESCDIESETFPCWLDSCYRGVLTDNRIQALGGWGDGVYLQGSMYIELHNNSFTDCSIDITGWQQSNYDTHTITPDNTVNGRPILHYQDLSGLVVDGADAGEVIVVDCEDVEVLNMQFSNGFAGVIAAYSNRVMVEDCSFTSCWIGIRVVGCTEVAVRSNVLEGVMQQGIGLWSTDGADVDGNTLSSGFFGYQDLMPVYHSSDVRVANNTLTDSWRGVSMFSTYGVEVSGNTVSDMVRDGMSIGYSSDVLVTGNVFEGNGVGLRLERCSLASVHHNDFLGNDVQAMDTDGTDNLWDEGYPSGGNYWSDYTGTDADGDGIGDTPYLFDVGAQDRYPLMLPCVY